MALQIASMNPMALSADSFINQGASENRTIAETLDLGWELLSMLPRNMLDRVDDKMAEKSSSETFFSRVFTLASHSALFAFAFSSSTFSFSNLSSIGPPLWQSAITIKMLLPVLGIDGCVLNRVSAMKHHAISYIDANMAGAVCGIGAFEKD